MEVGKPGSENLLSLLDKINTGSMKLPEFQRDFRWDIGDLTELIISMMNGFPAGSLLFWKVGGSEKKLVERIFEEAPNTSTLTDWLVLDGQQRLTTLYQLYYKEYVTLKGNRKRWFFLDLNEVKKGKLEESVLHFTENEVKKQRLLEIKAQTERGLLPFVIIRDEQSLRNWKSEYAKQSVEHEVEITKFTESILREVDSFDTQFLDRDKPVANLLSYEFNYVELPTQLSMEAVATIFEKLNTTGQPLNIFEILTAKFYKNVNLREKWKDARNANSQIDRFSKDEKDTSLPIIILKAILLKKAMSEPVYEKLECKRKNLLEDLTHLDLSKYWDSAIESFEYSLQTLTDQFGVASREYLPYTTILAPFSVIQAYIEEKISGDKKLLALRKLRAWYWTSVLQSRYDSSTDTISKEDVKEVISWINDGTEIPCVRKFDVNGLEFGDLTGSAQNTAITNIQIENNSRDFLTGELIATKIKNNPRSVDKHHIYPTKYLERHFGERSKEYNMRNSILNIAVIIDDTNRNYIKDDAPSNYIKGMSRTHSDAFTNIKSHLIPVDNIDGDKFEKFLDERKTILIRKIKELITC